MVFFFDFVVIARLSLHFQHNLYLTYKRDVVLPIFVLFALIVYVIRYCNKSFNTATSKEIYGLPQQNSYDDLVAKLVAQLVAQFGFTIRPSTTQ